MAVIKAPNKEYTGLSAGVEFENGIGKTDKPHLVAWFKEHGYEVEEETPMSERYQGSMRVDWIQDEDPKASLTEQKPKRRTRKRSGE